MIGYATLGTNDLARASAFYEQLLGELGARRVMSSERMTMFAASPDRPMLAVCTPFDGKPASAGNGTMLALNVGSQDAVRRIHAKALALGGSDEGAPGPRTAGGYFAYFRDLDGNKLAAFVLS
jgi:catechol 2,3-dioxygenase-like lactoylglutathione lyase family enzyme